MKLSPNFSVRELTKSQTAERKGIDNTPTEEHLENLKLLCENILQPIRDEWGVVSVSSGYRSPSLCQAIGSSEKSQHARGQAADFECHSIDNKELFEVPLTEESIPDIVNPFDNLPDPTLGPVSQLPPLVDAANPIVVAQNQKLIPGNFNNLTQAQKYQLLFRD